MIRKDEIGKEIIVQAGCDLTNIVTITMKISKPDGTKVDWIPDSNDIDSYSYKTIAGDLDQEGCYILLETQYTFSNGDYFRGSEDRFDVLD